MKQGEIRFANLDPTVGTEIQKRRPCLIVSPDSLNETLPRVIIAPITSSGVSEPFRPDVDADGVNGPIKGYILLDQLRTLDKQRLDSLEAVLPANELADVLVILRAMFR
jgi:mRNA interferase MazF